MFDFLNFLIISFFIGFFFNHKTKSVGYRGPLSDHFNGKRFFNNPARRYFNPRENRFTEFLIFSAKKLDSKVWRKRPLANGQAVPDPRVVGGEIVVTFVNHSTVLIQTEGLNILTDPVWSNRASPVRFMGPSRYVDPGIAIDKLPKIDLVLLSHNHYDHMDIAALRRISKRDKPTIFTPLGNTVFLRSKGIHESFDMDWGQSRKFSDLVTVDCVPAQHFSARALSDRDRTLWGGFVLHTPHGDIYFAGDTGYGPCISHIQKMYPNGFRLGFVPIGAYEPRSFMRDVHASPDEAVQICRELQIKNFIPIHFGTFDLALDGQDDPLTRLQEILGEEKNKKINCHILKNGDKVCINTF